MFGGVEAKHARAKVGGVEFKSPRLCLFSQSSCKAPGESPFSLFFVVVSFYPPCSNTSHSKLQRWTHEEPPALRLQPRGGESPPWCLSFMVDVVPPDLFSPHSSQGAREWHFRCAAAREVICASPPALTPVSCSCIRSAHLGPAFHTTIRENHPFDADATLMYECPP